MKKKVKIERKIRKKKVNRGREREIERCKKAA